MKENQKLSKRQLKIILIIISVIIFSSALLLTGYFIGKNSVSSKPVTSQNNDIISSPSVQPEISASPETLEITVSPEALPSISASASNDTENISENSSQNTWNKDTVYNGGEQVIYNGKIYQAGWWTQGDTPDPNNPWGVWKFINDSDISNNVSTVNESEAPVNFTEYQPLDSDIFKIVGYYPDWNPDKANSIAYKQLTHINYAFAIPTSEGTLREFENPALAKKIIKEGHKNDIKVLIAIGGWSYNDTPLEPTFVAATQTDAKCKKLSDNILALVDEYGFDGVDMDWEHPRVDGDSKNQYTKLMKYLRQGLTKRKKLLTSAVLAGVSADGNVLWDSAAHTDEALGYVDWINVMAYDGGDGDRHSSYDFAVNSSNYWLKNRKLPKEKVVLGVPFYARPSWASYEEILKADSSADAKDSTTYNGMEAHYNGLATIKKKTEWSLKNAGGIMIWEISQDTTNQKKSLLNQIRQTVEKNTGK